MTPHLTIVYVTGRRNPRFEWFAASLARQTGGDFRGISLVVVDFWAEGNGGEGGPLPNTRHAYFVERLPAGLELRHVPPKPTVWQGRYRRTRRNYFAAANARNTGTCLAKDGWIAYVDDLSVLVPGWLEAARHATRDGFIALGAYRKVKGLRVQNGEILAPADPGSPTDPAGVDSRWAHGHPTLPVPATGSWLYGCSVVMPVEAIIAANGWDERADARGLGSEDYLTGMLVERHGYGFRYYRRMLTLEDDEAHGEDAPMVREIATSPGRPDESHVLLGHVRDTSVRRAPNPFELLELRRRILDGGSFPVERVPEHDWYSGTRLEDL